MPPTEPWRSQEREQRIQHLLRAKAHGSALMAEAFVPELWVPTGGVVGEQYAKLRSGAMAEARARNRFYQEARMAFVAGNHRAANECSRKAKQHDKAMRALHKQAAELTVRNRNAGNGKRNVLDLHGLHVSEAVHYLDAWLKELQRCHEYEVCYVITGAGVHSHLSAHRRGRLLPAVRGFIRDNDFRFKEGKGSLKGTLCVWLR